MWWCGGGSGVVRGGCCLSSPTPGHPWEGVTPWPAHPAYCPPPLCADQGGAPPRRNSPVYPAAADVLWTRMFV